MPDGTFLAYVALLMISATALLILAVGGFGQSTGARLLDALFGVGFLSYAIYLLFFFEGGSVRIFFYAFIVPVIAVVNVVKALKAKREQQAAPYGTFNGYPGQASHPQYGYAPGQPGFGGQAPQPGQPAYPGQPGQPAYPGQPGQPGYPIPTPQPGQPANANYPTLPSNQFTPPQQ